MISDKNDHNKISPSRNSQVWDNHWKILNKKNSLLNFLQTFYRKQIIARAVNYYINRFFQKTGTFVECGSGTSQTTLKTVKYDRKFIALDYSKQILEITIKNPVIDECVHGDIFKLPFQSNSLDGIWNVGVMEHFYEHEINSILKEFKRVLKNDANIIIFWPMKFSPYILLINFYERILKYIFKKKINIYPDEVTRLKSKNHAKEIFIRNEFKNVKTFFNYRDLFSFCIIVCSK
jgi:ubiquinone/menaquinone biosynthesis C-methylase UbiE